MKPIWKVVQIGLLLFLAGFYWLALALLGLMCAFMPGWTWMYNVTPIISIIIVYLIACEIIRIYKLESK